MKIERFKKINNSNFNLRIFINDLKKKYLDKPKNRKDHNSTLKGPLKSARSLLKITTKKAKINKKSLFERLCKGSIIQKNNKTFIEQD